MLTFALRRLQGEPGKQKDVFVFSTHGGDTEVRHENEKQFIKCRALQFSHREVLLH